MSAGQNDGCTGREDGFGQAEPVGAAVGEPAGQVGLGVGAAATRRLPSDCADMSASRYG
jgi:hypothetical protein